MKGDDEAVGGEEGSGRLSIGDGGDGRSERKSELLGLAAHAK